MRSYYPIVKDLGCFKHTQILRVFCNILTVNTSKNEPWIWVQNLVKITTNKAEII